jgi:hypothetical protein
MDGARPRNTQGNGARLNARIDALAGSEEGGAIVAPPKTTFAAIDSEIASALGYDLPGFVDLPLGRSIFRKIQNEDDSFCRTVLKS